MASLEIVALDTVTPQLRAPGVGDTYSVPRDMVMTLTNGLGYWFNSVGSYGLGFQSGSASSSIYANGIEVLRTNGSTPFGINVFYRVGLGTTAATADVGIERIAAKVLKITDGGVAAGPSGAGVIQLPTFTVAGLPTAASAGAGARSTVSDGSVVAAGNFGTIVAGAGANIVPVYSDATNWRIG